MARSVNIDAGTIAFTLDLSGNSYFHSINRSTGALFIKAPNGELMLGYRCDRAKPKF